MSAANCAGISPIARLTGFMPLWRNHGLSVIVAAANAAGDVPAAFQPQPPLPRRPRRGRKPIPTEAAAAPGWPRPEQCPDHPGLRCAGPLLALALLVCGYQDLAGAAPPRPLHGVVADARAGWRQAVTQVASLMAGSDESLGARVLAYARQQAGRQVGDGECYDLADQALIRSGARSAPSFDDVTPGADYMWGTEVALRDARPGDILQFRGFNVRTSVTTRQFLPDGRSYTMQNWMLDEREHHTAIVESNEGNTLVVLEQNVPPLGRVVQRTRIPIASMTYDGDGIGPPRGLSTTTVQVDGTIRAYRPQRASPP